MTPTPCATEPSSPPQEAPQALLEVRDLAVRYGHIDALRGVSFHVCQGEVVTLIGANGAGKSSALRAVSGLVPFSGAVTFRGHSLARVAPDAIVARGIAHVPEGRAIFGNLTVQENLALATWTRHDRTGAAQDLERVFAWFPRLAERRRQMGGTLSGGEQQMLAIGRALMTRADLLLLDEPSMGLAPVLVQEIFRILREINRRGVTLLLVEQNAAMALELADRAYVLETGSLVLSGAGSELRRHPRVQEAYLGG
jgi:branched-chain amino acid transport system ATP-binding protein